MADTLLIDSTVLIDEQRGHADARVFLEPLLTRGAAVVHPVSAAEVLAGVNDRNELAALDQLLARFRLVHTRHADFTAPSGMCDRSRCRTASDGPIA